MQMRATATQKKIREKIESQDHLEVSLDFEHVRAAVRRKYSKPFLLLDRNIIREKAQRFKVAMPRIHPHYAVKANPDQRVLKTLIHEGVGFEIASISELDLLISLGVAAQEIYYSNPVKSSDYIRYASSKGVEWFALDSIEELRKIVNIKQDAKMYLRIDTPNIGSDWPLAGKFGTHSSDINEIINEAAKLNVALIGVTFHVGSQCRNPLNWEVGITRAKKVFNNMRLAGLSPRLLNIGGGFPVQYVKPIPSIEVIGEVVNKAIEGLSEDVRIMAEPGRYLVSDSGYFICRVLGTTTRSGKKWMYWDAGIFGGVIEITEGLRYRIITDRDGHSVPWTVAGPTCDSVDILLRDEMLPADIQEGDFIYIPNAGAYTTTYASNFNGFPLPDVFVL
ncbi:MAG: decarboxylase [Nitrosomonadaceae bacterium]|nr:decarboxylase [Nitrosomonadaceae bacterium]|tara:strand:+ start:4357 stop:5532 length:1176 start_codon:yes stop_codon:yes gene_type:complete